VIRALRRIFDEAVTQVAAHEATDTHAVHLAAAALLVEMSRADHRIDDRERAHIASALEEQFGLSAQEVRELVSAGETGADEATSLYEFTRHLNEHFSHEQKVLLVDQLWRVAYADGELEKHEAHLVRKVADLLHLRHSEYIGGKLRNL
jgi:uncharacterized tellurite resistance protein B-like protein